MEALPSAAPGRARPARRHAVHGGRPHDVLRRFHCGVGSAAARGAQAREHHPTRDTNCLDSFAVDVYLDDAGRIVAVTVELHEP